MNAFRALLVGMTLALAAYTAIAVSHEGWSLFTIFFQDVAKARWAGQFDLDFSCYLLLSGSWIAWRHRFTPAGIALGLLGSIGGTLVLAPYLIVESFRAKGDMRALLLGSGRATE
jgi:hypothetical protein